MFPSFMNYENVAELEYYHGDTSDIKLHACRPTCFLTGPGDLCFDLPTRARFLRLARLSFLLGVLDVSFESKNTVTFL